ncbi:uncharacterized protein M6B38_254185 [Iris pallida]|uniref:Chlororespiratory reduction 3 n=1 Tax=Iris pallida TaxID=29817 RepID=A0AAX6IIS1_IRIPA|nr:uncharacterized protein M6B38_107670 [Iris pallida]KAJ6852724.1 uncharacterized protein M6B38_254185 [Iris pallida]
MGWAVAARPSLLPTVVSAGSADGPRPRRRPARRNDAPPRPKQPSVAEVRRAIGVDSADDFSSPRNSSSSSSSPTSFMDFLASTPIGQVEGPVERTLRQTAEWFADQTEANAKSGQKILIVVCLKILPVWLVLLLLASGVVKLPFDVPFIEDLIS